MCRTLYQKPTVEEELAGVTVLEVAFVGVRRPPAQALDILIQDAMVRCVLSGATASTMTGVLFVVLVTMRFKVTTERLDIEIVSERPSKVRKS